MRILPGTAHPRVSCSWSNGGFSTLRLLRGDPGLRALAAVACASHAWEAIGPPPPPSLPHLHALAFTELGFVGFLGVYAYCYVRLWACARDVGAGKLKAN